MQGASSRSFVHNTGARGMGTWRLTARGLWTRGMRRLPRGDDRRRTERSAGNRPVRGGRKLLGSRRLGGGQRIFARHIFARAERVGHQRLERIGLLLRKVGLLVALLNSGTHGLLGCVWGSYGARRTLNVRITVGRRSVGFSWTGTIGS